MSVLTRLRKKASEKFSEIRTQYKFQYFNGDIIIYFAYEGYSASVAFGDAFIF